MVVPTNSKEAAFRSWDRLVLGQKVRRCVARVAIVVHRSSFVVVEE
jgi:hypothetical protein